MIKNALYWLVMLAIVSVLWFVVHGEFKGEGVWLIRIVVVAAVLDVLRWIVWKVEPPIDAGK